MSVRRQLEVPSDGFNSGAMDAETLEFAVTLFSALAHPTRLRMVELLTDGELSVGEIAQSLGILQPSTSQHLAILSRAGVVRVSRQGSIHAYRIRGPRIARILELVDEFRQIHGPALRGEMGE